MNKLYVVLLVSLLSIVFCTPAFALFTNGGFEDGTLNGWTVRTGQTFYGGVGGIDEVSWNGMSGPGAVIIGSGYADPYSPFDGPFYGNYMAMINDGSGGYHATQLSQADTVTAADLATDGLYHLYFGWGAVINNPSGHPYEDQPFFDINVLVNGVSQYHVEMAGNNAGAGGWTAGGSNFYYNSSSQDINILALGDTVEVVLSAVDCGWGAHGGYAYIDGFGSEYVQDPGDPDPNQNPVPEPMTALLFGPALIGLVGLKKKA
ncbi:MAG: hypothetical protein KJ915_02570 [Candidatus Omnitrophica bacterium]|nr:hypothetical protein [Candidatus Omnitrophota bacterium]